MEGAARMAAHGAHRVLQSRAAARRLARPAAGQGQPREPPDPLAAAPPGKMPGHPTRAGGPRPVLAADLLGDRADRALTSDRSFRMSRTDAFPCPPVISAT